MGLRGFRIAMGVGILGSLLLVNCARETPEAQVKKAFAACVASLEAGKVPEVADVLTPNFQGPHSMRRQEAVLFLMGVTRREKIRVTLFHQDLERQGTDVYQRVEVMLSGRSGNSLFPDEMSRKTFLLRWEKDGGDWKIREIREEGRGDGSRLGPSGASEGRDPMPGETGA